MLNDPIDAISVDGDVYCMAGNTLRKAGISIEEPRWAGRKRD